MNGLKYIKMELPIDRIICGDSLTVLKTFPDQSVDLVVTSPPYNIRNSAGDWWKHSVLSKKKLMKLHEGYDTYSDDLPHDDYVRWQRDVLTECMRILRPKGAIFYNHKWRVQNGLIQDRADIVSGFPVRQIIIWHRNGGINFSESFFLPTYEVIYMIAKPEFRIKMSSSGLSDVWYIPHEPPSNAHPAPFPVEIPRRIISATNAEIILDPFAGSGTTAVAAKELGRHYIGIEISPKYCDMANERIAKTSKQMTLI